MVGDGRSHCCVPFCRRYRRGEGETICWEHWKRIPLARRRAYLRAAIERCPELLARERRPIPRWMRQRPERTLYLSYTRPRSIKAIWRLWDRLKRDAIERAL